MVIMKVLGVELINWLVKNVHGFRNRKAAKNYASSLLANGYNHTYNHIHIYHTSGYIRWLTSGILALLTSGILDMLLTSGILAKKVIMSSMVIELVLKCNEGFLINDFLRFNNC